MHIKQVYIHYQRAVQSAGGYEHCPFCTKLLVMKERGHKLRPACPGCGFVQYHNPAPSVSVLIVDGDKVLLGKRKGDPGKGTWALPSGYIEFEDDFLSTAIQEAKQETGLDVQIQSILNIVSSFTSPRFHFMNLFVEATVLGGVLAAGDDLEVVEWFPISGPLPQMGFQEDLDTIQLYAQKGLAGLPVDPDYAIQKQDESG